MSNERVSPFHSGATVNMVNPNCLDNFYFINPVNQRGQASYNTSGKIIDRWHIIPYSGKLELTGEGAKISPNAADGNFYFAQYVETSRAPAGEIVTATLLYSDGTITTGTGKATAQGQGNLNFAGSPIFVYLEPHATYYSFTIALSKDLNEKTITAAKLELGPVQTLAHLDSTGKWVLNEIPNYVEELNKCRYYYRVFDTEAQRTANNWGMRLANPVQGTISIDGATKYTLDANL